MHVKALSFFTPLLVVSSLAHSITELFSENLLILRDYFWGLKNLKFLILPESEGEETL